ncbi:hypothetical protein [Pedobacter glucosidilyticus]|uniref:AbiU2 domain-containing protein n=1 Tax=Pedobacter glucosidilyticus TaxID=1122941 RepID=UPI000419E7DD|nr:hypothetical protein [Pedobacter glucosidilyticus]
MENIVLKKYEDYLEAFESIIYDNLAIKLAAFKGFKECLDSDFKTASTNLPLLYFIINSMHVDTVMTICKLIENNRGEGTIQNFLNFISSNQKIIQKKYKDCGVNVVNDNKVDLESLNEKIIIIIKQRDKYFAHADKEYFLNPNKISIDFPNTYDDISDILRVLQKIISAHIFIVSKRKRACIADFFYLNTFKIINLLNNKNNITFKGTD